MKGGAHTPSVLQVVSFVIEDHLYGLDICAVKEVNPSTAISPVPGAPRHIRGLLNIRGQVVLVMDISVILGHGPRPITDTSQIVILKTFQEISQARTKTDHVNVEAFDDKLVGFLVDRIGDVTALSAGSLEPCPPHLDQRNVRFVRGVARMEDKPLVVLDAGEMLAAESGEAARGPSPSEL